MYAWCKLSDGLYTLCQSGAGCNLGVKAVMGEILGIGAVMAMGCITCVREVRCGILGVKAVMGGILYLVSQQLYIWCQGCD